MKGLHDPQLLAALLRPFGPQPDAIRPSNVHPCPCVAASASLAFRFGFTNESSASASRLQRIPRGSALTRQERYARSISRLLRLQSSSVCPNWGYVPVTKMMDSPPEGLRRPRAAWLIVYGRKDRMDDRSRVAPSYSLERCPPFVLVPMSVLRRGILKEHLERAAWLSVFCQWTLKFEHAQLPKRRTA
jgi:hypothetical protein